MKLKLQATVEISRKSGLDPSYAHRCPHRTIAETHQNHCLGQPSEGLPFFFNFWVRSILFLDLVTRR